VEAGLVPSDIAGQATGKVVFAKPVNETVVYSIPPAQFSYSQLNDFEACPLKYKYQHYLKLPVPGNCHLSFGQSMHKVFEEYLNLYKTSLEMAQQDLFGGAKQPGLPEFKQLDELYEKHWVDDWYKDQYEKMSFKKRGRDMLMTFYERLKQQPVTPKHIEKFFKLKIGSYNFVGKIDRIDSISGGISIIDYKTGKAKKNGNKKKDLDQLHIYQWAAEEFLKEKVLNLKYWYLLEDLPENQFKEEQIASPKDLADLKSRLQDAIERIAYVTKYNLFKEEHKKAKDHKCEFEHLE
jgi:DNA helicase-2/ATP-dependent DNA helicase PcrA